MRKEIPHLEIISNEKDRIATILLYGSIGPSAWWSDEQGITDAEFSKVFDVYDKKGYQVHIRVNGNGGRMDHGQAIISRIRRAQADVHTYVDGVAASMSCAILFAVPSANRHIPSNAIIHFHAPIGGVYGNAILMRETADMLDVFEQSGKNVIKENSKITDENLATLFDGKDHWLTAQQAKDMGLIDFIETYQVDDEAVKEQVAFLSAMKPDLLNNHISEDKIIPPKETEKMDIHSFKTALAEGKITAEDALNAVKAHTPSLFEKEEKQAQEITALSAQLTDIARRLAKVESKAAEPHSHIKQDPPSPKDPDAEPEMVFYGGLPHKK